MMARLNKTLRFALPAAVLLVAIGIYLWLEATRPQLSPVDSDERTWSVAAIHAEVRDWQPKLKVYGEVISGRDVDVRALIEGPVIHVSDNMVEGGIVHAGDSLLTIDPFDHQAKIDERMAQLAEAQARLDEYEKSHAIEAAALERDYEHEAISEKDLARIRSLRAEDPVSEKTLDNAVVASSRQRQQVLMRKKSVEVLSAKLVQQTSVIDQLEVAVRRALRDLDRTALAAPVSGFLTETSVALGQRLGVGERVARLVIADAMEVRINLSDSQFGRLLQDGPIAGRPAVVIWSAGSNDTKVNAVLERIGAHIDASSGGVDVYATLRDVGIDSMLRPGAFVAVELNDHYFADVVRLPESALHGDLIYTIVDGRLEERQVMKVGFYDRDVLVRGQIATGDEVLITRLTEVSSGLRVEVR